MEATTTQERVLRLKILGLTGTHGASTSPSMGWLVPVTQAQAPGWSSPDLSRLLDKQMRAFAGSSKSARGVPCERYRAGPHLAKQRRSPRQRGVLSPGASIVAGSTSPWHGGDRGDHAESSWPDTETLGALLASPACGLSQHSDTGVWCHLPVGKCLGISKRVMPWEQPTPCLLGMAEPHDHPTNPTTSACPAAPKPSPAQSMGAEHSPS